MGPFDPAQVQIHDVNPGDLNETGLPNHFPDGGVFWTRTVPTSSISMKPGKGDAEFHVDDLAMTEYFTVVNALFRENAPPPFNVPPIPATGSAHVSWHGTGDRLHLENNDVEGSGQGYAGQYESADCDISWSISNADGYYFSTDDPGEAPPLITHAFTAHVHSGMFNP